MRRNQLEIPPEFKFYRSLMSVFFSAFSFPFEFRFVTKPYGHDDRLEQRISDVQYYR